MPELITSIFTALWLGILTSISPCPLASNIAAVSFISKELESKKKAFLSGLMYTLGRITAYVGISIPLLYGLLSIPGIANFLQKYMNIVIGPILIFTGFVLLGVLKFMMPAMIDDENARKTAEKRTLFGAFLLGILFALSFCPISAGLFFGSLIPVALKYKSLLLMPSIFGLGTGLPVLFFAFLIVFSAEYTAKAFSMLSTFAKWAKYITAVIFILAGIYLSIEYIFGIDLI